MIRLPVAAAAAATGLALVSLLATAELTPALGHANLVSSAPGAGSVVDVSPTEIRLVFSEQIEPRGTSADVLDDVGHVIVAEAGQPDPTDPFSLIVTVPTLANGAYTVQWRSLSAADGHVAQGFFTFAVGAGSSPPPINTQSAGGDIHAGHTAATALLETIGRATGDLGVMLLFGLALIALAVVLPVAPELGRALARAAAGSAAVGAAGALVLGYSSAQAAQLPTLDYMLGTHNGVMLLARAGLLIAGTVALLLIALRSTRAAALSAAGIGIATTVLLAASGHAGAFSSALPIVAMTVHVAAAGTWLAGLLVLAAIALVPALRRSPAATLPPLTQFVPRFSALALMAAALFGLTGLAFAGELAGGVVVLDSPYGWLVDSKIVLVLVALGLGGLNFLAPRHADGRPGALRWRIPIEAGVAFVVVVVSALLASGTPPAPLQPQLLAPAGSTSDAAITLAIEPGRPGPQRFVATVAQSATTVNLDLQRIDLTQGTSLVPMRADPTQPGRWISDGGLLPPDSSWTATVVAIDQSGTEIGRQRFDMTFDGTQLTAGAADTGISVAVLAGLLLLALSVLGLTMAIAGLSLPRTPQRLGRYALLVGSFIAGPLGLVLLFAWRN